MYSRTQRRFAWLVAWVGLIPLASVAPAEIVPVNPPAPVQHHAVRHLPAPHLVAFSDCANAVSAAPTMLLEEPPQVVVADSVPATQPARQPVVIDDPLPPAFWSGLIMLALAAAFVSMPRFRRRLLRW